MKRINSKQNKPLVSRNLLVENEENFEEIEYSSKKDLQLQNILTKFDNRVFVGSTGKKKSYEIFKLFDKDKDSYNLINLFISLIIIK